MKISVLTCSVSRSAGGLLDAIRDLYRNKNIPKGSVTVYSYTDEYTSEDLPSWRPLTLKLYPKTNPFYYSGPLKKDLLASDTDVLHVHGLWRYPHAFINAWKKTTRKPVVVTPHGMLDPYIIRNQSPLKRILGKYLFAGQAFKNTDCYHALCKAEMEVMRAYGITAPIAIIPNGVDMPSGQHHFIRSDEKKHLLYLGRLHPKKGVDMLLEAIGQLKQRAPELLKDWVVDIVGWPQENFDRKLNAIVEKYDLANEVKFHGGLFGEEKVRMYAVSDAYILPSHGEGLPMTVLEAWSWGVPVIMTPECNLPEGFEVGAALKINNTVESVYENLLQFFQLPDIERKQMGEIGKELVKKEFTWNASAFKMKKLYEWLISDQNCPEFVFVAKTTEAIVTDKEVNTAI